MPFTLVQAANALKTVNTDGFISSSLALPAGVSLASNLTPRFARFNQGTRAFIILVNTPTRPISIDDTGTTRVLTPNPPTSAVVLSTGGAGTLSGTYLSLQTYVIKDANGNTISESNYGPLMANAFTVSNANLKATFSTSPDNVTTTRLYRTVTGPGASYFKWADVGDNTSTTYEDSASDATISLLPAADLGSAPDLTLIATWQGRLWGVDRTDVDHLRYTESGTMYAWSALNSIPIGRIGQDETGITALIARRNYLGVARKNQFLEISGTTRTNFLQTNLSEECGCDSQESVVVFQDKAYFLWHDGVYVWDDSGIRSVTNGRVRAWFTTDTYFNRAMFWRSFASLDPVTLRYRLFLASAGSSVIDSWVEYDLITGAWWGIHSTKAFAPTCAVSVYGANQKYYSMIGSNEGYLSQDQETRTDWDKSIPFHVKTRAHDNREPDYEKYAGELSMNGPVLTSGTVTVTPTVGNLNASAGTPFSWDLTKGRQRLQRLGYGKQVTLDLENDEVAQDVIVQGYEINPFDSTGRR